MNIEARLKQLRKILPNVEYTQRSRAYILGIPQEVVAPRLTLRHFILQNIQLGSAIALTGLLLMLGFGGFSAWKTLSPFGLASLDPANLRAEADAVRDFQVALNSIQYVAPEPIVKDQPMLARTSPRTSSEPAPVATTLRATGTEDHATTTEDIAASSSTSYDYSTTTVDAALDMLLN